jgi:hypothetical protein
MTNRKEAKRQKWSTTEHIKYRKLNIEQREPLKWG